jgi:hypothetical protein
MTEFIVPPLPEGVGTQDDPHFMDRQVSWGSDRDRQHAGAGLLRSIGWTRCAMCEGPVWPSVAIAGSGEIRWRFNRFCSDECRKLNNSRFHRNRNAASKVVL